MTMHIYFKHVTDTISRVEKEQKEFIKKAAELIVSAVRQEQTIFAFGASHSFIMAEEMVYRTGGLILVNPIYPHGMNLSVRPLTMTSKIERLPGLGLELLEGAQAAENDVLLLFSTSGRNTVVIDMAMRAAEKKMKTIAVTALSYTNKVASRHSSGKKLADLCDIVIDNGAPYGDAAVKMEGFPDKVGPLSSVIGCAIVNAMVVEVVSIMIDNGEIPPVFMSANVDGGDEHNRKLLSENAHRIRYM